jgi:phage replication-related protein YjqB (UPF0714/DUF867 family)
VFADLLAQPGVVEDVALAGPVGVMAFHGGSLEEATDTIALAVAAAAGASSYVVALPPGLRWHVPSRLIGPEESTRLAAFLDHVELAVALHGYGRQGRWTSLLLGGRNRGLAELLAAELRARLPGYESVTDLDRIPAELRGLHPANPVNRARRGGVQVELPPRVRGLSPMSVAADTDNLVEALAAGVRAASRTVQRLL